MIEQILYTDGVTKLVCHGAIEVPVLGFIFFARHPGVALAPCVREVDRIPVSVFPFMPYPKFLSCEVRDVVVVGGFLEMYLNAPV